MKTKLLLWKRALRSVLLVLLLSALGMTKTYAYDFSAVCETGQTLYYSITDATNHYVNLVYPGSQSWNGWSGFTKPTGDITLPSSVDYEGVAYSVTTIGEYAFYNCTGLTSLTIGNSVTSTGTYAFSGCNGLNAVNYTGNINNWCNISFSNSQSNPLYYAHNLFIDNELVSNLVIPETLTEIKPYAFDGATCLTSLTIGNSVTTIGGYAFRGCTGLTSLTIGNSVTTIGGYAFGGCTGLTSLTIGNSVTSIGEYAFGGCSSLTSLTLPNSVTTIGRSAFSGCSGLTSLTLPNSVTSIGEYAFSRCSGLTSIEIPNSVTSIGGNAFDYCTGLTSLTIGNSVTSIGSSAFSGCSGLTSLTLPNSVTSIGNSAFSGCTGLNAVNYTGDINNWCNISFSYYSNPLYYAHNLFINDELVTDLVIPETVTEIKPYAFDGATCLISLSIGNSVTSIGYMAFSGCSGLEQITVDSGNTVYDSRESCNAIIITSSNSLVTGCKNTVIPNSVTSIGSGAFYNCSGLTSIEIPNSVTTILDGAFYNCSGLTGDLIIPNSVTAIWNSAFSNCSGFTGDLTIPNSVISIGDWAFCNCSGFTGDLTIGNSVTSIGESAFKYCSGFTGDLTIGNSVTTIGTNAFQGCSGFTGNLTIGNSVTWIGNFAFIFCGNFTEVFYNATNYPDGTMWSPLLGCGGSITIGDNVERIPAHMFYYVPASSFGFSDDYEFNRFSGRLTIGNSVTSIGEDAFYGCYFTELIVPCGFPIGAYLDWNQFTNIQEICSQSQTVTLSAGWNWFSTNVETTLDDLKSALVEALPGTNITIKSRTQNIAYNPTTNQWKGTLNELDVAQMYMISVGNGCEITLEGMPINPSEHSVTIHNGANWIAFPFTESMSVSEAFAGFAINGDVIKSRSTNSSYINGQWRGGLNTLEPGQGYIYKSNATDDRIFTFPVSAK